MADAADVFAGITREPGIRYTALVPNLAGLDRAIAAGVTEIAVFAASTETFSRKNINQSIDESLATYAQVCERARASGLRVRGYLSTAFGCPYEGAVAPERVADVAARLAISASSRSRSATPSASRIPGRSRRVLDAVLTRVPARTDRAALSRYARNRARQRPRRRCPTGWPRSTPSAGGLGGCPYAPGAAGNLATDDLIYMLDGLGIETGVSLAAVSDASAFIASKIDHRLPSRYAQAVEGKGAGR